ncbi:hypothetical protein [Algoriphagus winogradskyi]|uniref:hypothetical protein n=1 Tax=Algoriphagus winogradskyi TaxID=237017 RepID=UPI0024B76D2D|nr:hypothetical protein [Algoriphagus winogradskyi]
MTSDPASISVSSRLLHSWDRTLKTDIFAWQTGYAAYAVSESIVEKVFQYIQNQKKHHQKLSFQEEYEEF